MRTTLDLPDDVLRLAKIAAIERGSSLRQIVIDALRRDLQGDAAAQRVRIAGPLITLSPDAPARNLSPEAIKKLDEAAQADADEARNRALRR
ncbi:MAG TPA: hypothetical protein VJ724_13150 [Tahibacter sp.]|nr:hypothetical protein [Tahibacter sp.]